MKILLLTLICVFSILILSSTCYSIPKCQFLCDNEEPPVFDRMQKYDTTSDDTIIGLVQRTTGLLTKIAFLIGPGLGNMFCLIGIAKIRRKEEDPREFSKGVTYFVSGIGCIMLGVIIQGILKSLSPQAASTFVMLNY